MFQLAVEVLSQVFVVVLSLNALIVPPLVVVLLFKNGQCDREMRKVLKVNRKAAKRRAKQRARR